MSQLVTKFIQDNAVTDAKFRGRNNAAIRIRNAANSADVDTFKLNTSDQLVWLIQPKADASLPLPSASKDYVTVEWAENRIIGKGDPKDAVYACADTNVALTGVTPLTIDGVTVPTNKRVLLSNQSTATQNGVYVNTITGGNYALTRAPDFDQGSDDTLGLEVTQGAYFKIVTGTAYQNWEAILTTADVITVGTTVMTFALNPTVTALVGGDMVTKSGNTITLDLATNGGLESTNPGNAAGQLRVKTDTSAAEKDITVKRSTTDGGLLAKKSRQLTFTLTATDITNQYVDLDAVAGDSSVLMTVVGGGKQTYNIDFGINYTGGTGGKTRVSYLNGLATGGVSELVAGDTLDIQFMSF